jgi:hypothetical protein
MDPTSQASGRTPRAQSEALTKPHQASEFGPTPPGAHMQHSSVLGSPVVATRRMQAAGIDTFGGEVQLLELAAPAFPAPDEVACSPGA